MSLTVQNVSRLAIEDKAFNLTRSPAETLFIQICDDGEEHPNCDLDFHTVIQLNFDDTEDENNERCISREDAEIIAAALRQAYTQNLDILVHCYAGIFRSGAVARAAQYIGYEILTVASSPNEMVLRMVIEEITKTPRPPKKKNWFTEDFLDRSYD